MPQRADTFGARLPLDVRCAEPIEERRRIAVQRPDVGRLHFPLARDLVDDELAVAAHGEGGGLWVAPFGDDAGDHILQGGDERAVLGLVVRDVIAEGQAHDLLRRAGAQLVRTVPLTRIPARAAIENNRVLRRVSLHRRDGIMCTDNMRPGHDGTDADDNRSLCRKQRSNEARSTKGRGMTALILTALLAVLWVGMIAIGYAHGGWRQVIVLTGILLSYAVVSEWAVPNGRDLSTQFHWSIPRATTGVALLYLLGGTAVLGYLGSFALARPRPLTATERQLGAAMGVLNGGLLLALVLRSVRSYAFAAGRGQILRESALSRFLIEQIGYVLLLALVCGAIAAVVGAVRARRVDVVDAPDVHEQMAPAVVPVPRAIPDAPPPVQISSPAPRPLAPAQPAMPEPVYEPALLPDRPMGPPPGTRIDPSVAPPAPTSFVPMHLSLPRRVEPLMVYPVGALLAGKERPITAPPVPVIPARESPPSPSPVPEAEQLPDAPAPVVRELDVATRDALPVVVRETETPEEAAALVALPVLDAGTQPETETTQRDEPIGGAMTPLEPEKQAPAPSPPNLPGVTETASLPAAAPPPLPSMRPQQPAVIAPPVALPSDETQEAATAPEHARQRSSFARVATARQAGSDPNARPAPQPASEPDPTRPPLPTGPRVHPCPTCGYPVRDHARYCPNCGSKQRP